MTLNLCSLTLPLIWIGRSQHKHVCNYAKNKKQFDLLHVLRTFHWNKLSLFIGFNILGSFLLSSAYLGQGYRGIDSRSVAQTILPLLRLVAPPREQQCSGKRGNVVPPDYDDTVPGSAFPRGHLQSLTFSLYCSVFASSVVRVQRESLV